MVGSWAETVSLDVGLEEVEAIVGGLVGDLTAVRELAGIDASARRERVQATVPSDYQRPGLGDRWHA